jgi:ATP-dependent Zn protease
MDPRMALVNPELAAGAPRDHGDQTAVNIDREVDRLIEEGLALAKSVLEERREVVEGLATRLLEEQQRSGLAIRRALGLPERAHETRSEPKAPEPASPPEAPPKP